MKLEELKTLWQFLQEIINEDYYSLHDFLIYATEEDRKRVEHELTDKDYNQYYEYLDSLTFENRDELETAICEYIEYTNKQPLWMWEMWDISDMADDYINERWLENLDED